MIENPYDFELMRKTLGSVQKMVYGNRSNSNQKAMMSQKTGQQPLDFSDFQIVPNFKYIKFTPTTHDELALLKSDPTLTLVDYPLSYQGADHYYISTGKSIPTEEELVSYYTSVPLDQTLPAIPYEQLQLMYLPDEDPYFDDAVENGNPTIEGVVYSKEDLINHLISIAYVESGNGNLLPPDVLETNEDGFQTKLFGISFRSRWTPSGSVNVWDDHIVTTTAATTERVLVGWRDVPCSDSGFNEPLEYFADDDGTSYGVSSISGMQLKPNQDTCREPIYEERPVAGTTTVGGYTPLVGAQILIRDTFTLSNEITDSNGRFTFKRVRPAVRYLIQWERRNYSIRDGGWQASLKGPKMRKKSWNISIRGGEDEYHANIHRGAHMYYYDNLPGLAGPPEASFRYQMKIAAVETAGSSSHAPIRADLSLGLLSTIRIKKYGFQTERVVGVMIHELAHAVHRVIDEGSYEKLVRNAYVLPALGLRAAEDNNKRLMESFATHIEITYMNEFYDRIGLDRKYRGFNLQNQTIAEERYYTTLLYDLTENVNQRIRFESTPIDNVENFTPLEIEDSMIGARSLDDFRRNLEALNKDSNADLQQLFNNW